MNKLIRTKLIPISITILLLLITILPCNYILKAAMKSDTLMTLDTQQNVSVIISYDIEDPDVYFVSPSGVTYKEGTTPTSQMIVSREDKVTYYQIYAAEKGTWKIYYDKLSNTTVTADFAHFNDVITLESLSIGAVSKDTLPVTLKTSFPKNVAYTYTISAVTLDSDGGVSGTRELATGTKSTNSTDTIDVDLSSLGSFDSYYIQAYVTLVDDGVDIFDSLVSTSSFKYTNRDTHSMIDDPLLTLDLGEEALTVDWSDSYKTNVEKYIIAFYEDASTEPAFYELDGNITDFTYPYTTGTKKLTYEVSYITSSKLNSQTYKAELDIEKYAAMIAFTTPEVTSASYCELEYKNMQNVDVTITVNSESTENTTLNGNGTFSVKLDSSPSDVVLEYEIDDLYIKYSRTFYVDRFAPTINFFEDLDKISTSSDTFLIVGSIEAGSTLTINGNDVSIEDDGYFKYSCDLEIGDNDIEFVATDKVGNSIKQTANISRVAVAYVIDSSLPFFIRFLPLELAFILGVIAVVFVMHTTSAKAIEAQKKKNSVPKANALSVKKIIPLQKKLFLIFAGLSLASLIATIFMIVRKVSLSNIVNTNELFVMLRKSTTSAYEKVHSYNIISSWLVVFIIFTIVFVILTICFKFIKRRPKLAYAAGNIIPPNVPYMVNNLTNPNVNPSMPLNNSFNPNANPSTPLNNSFNPIANPSMPLNNSFNPNANPVMPVNNNQLPPQN